MEVHRRWRWLQPPGVNWRGWAAAEAGWQVGWFFLRGSLKLKEFGWVFWRFLLVEMTWPGRGVLGLFFGKKYTDRTFEIGAPGDH